MTEVERTTTRKMETANGGNVTLVTKNYAHHVLSVNNGARDQREASSGLTYLTDVGLRDFLTLIEDAVREDLA